MRLGWSNLPWGMGSCGETPRNLVGTEVTGVQGAQPHRPISYTGGGRAGNPRQELCGGKVTLSSPTRTHDVPAPCHGQAEGRGPLRTWMPGGPDFPGGPIPEDSAAPGSGLGMRCVPSAVDKRHVNLPDLTGPG